MANRMVLTSVNQLIAYAQSNPQLVAAVPKLGTVSRMEPSVSPKKSCNCGSKMNFTTVDANKQVAESILSSLTFNDYQAIKGALGLDELCYYKRENGNLALICV